MFGLFAVVVRPRAVGFFCHGQWTESLGDLEYGAVLGVVQQIVIASSGEEGLVVGFSFTGGRQWDG